MPPKPDVAKTNQIAAILKQHNGNISEAARMLGLDRATIRYHRDKALAFNIQGDEEDGGVPDSPDRSLEEIIAARESEFERIHKYESANAVVNIKMNTPGPIGIAHFGDPHVDDPGTDIRLLRRHLDLVKETPGLFAANVGDLNNNWVGRLAALHNKHTISASEGWQLVKWLLEYPVDAATGQTKWLYVVGGNHDAWSGDRDLTSWFAKQGRVHYRYHGVRIKIHFANGREVRVNTRHDFKGNSMWNTAHAAMRAAQVSFKDHIFTCGHRHVSGYGIVVSPDTENQVISHCIRVSAYKRHDDYASKIGATPHDISPCAVTIIDPEAADENGLVTVIWNMENAVDYLTWLRAKRGHTDGRKQDKNRGPVKPNKAGAAVEVTPDAVEQEWVDDDDIELVMPMGKNAAPIKQKKKKKKPEPDNRYHSFM